MTPSPDDLAAAREFLNCNDEAARPLAMLLEQTRADEREACAKVAEAVAHFGIAAAIRARSGQPATAEQEK